MSLVDELSEYANKNPGRRIVDVQKWTINYTILASQLERFALCLVDNRQVSLGMAGYLVVPVATATAPAAMAHRVIR